MIFGLLLYFLAQKKSMKNTIIAILIIVFGLMFASCSSEETPVTPTKTSLSIEGIVSEEGTGRAIGQVFIFSTTSSHAVVSDIDGFYALKDLRAGTYTLTAVKSNYDTTKIVVTVDSARAVTRGDIVMRLVKNPGGIRGRVIDQSNDSGIVASNITTYPFQGQVNTDNSGNYLLLSVTPGSYDLTATKFGYSSKTIKMKVSADSISVVDFILEPLYGTITGKVMVDSLVTSPIEGVSISTTPATMVVTTDSSGNYTIYNVPKLTQASAKYTITAVKRGFTNATVQVDLIPGKTTRADILMRR